MVSNQIEFSNTYSKEVKEVRIKNKDFQGQLIIEDYLDLEKLYLRDIENIEKIILKNLPQLKWCTIRDCGTKDLAIENCPQMNSLNIENNLLTNLEFIKDLDGLEELELDGNDKLSEILEPYEDDWKTYRENLQKLVSSDKDLTKENIQELLRLQGESKKLKDDLELSQLKYNDLKKFLEGVLVSLSQEAKRELVNKLDKETKRKGSFSAQGRTKELMLITDEVIKSAKEIKRELESKLTESKTKIEDLEKALKEKNELYREKEIELKLKQKDADNLLDKLLEKSAEKGQTADKGEKESLQKEIDVLRKKLDEAKEKEFELKGELRAKKEEIERMSKTIEKAIDTPKVQNIQNTVIGSQSINTYQIQYNLYYQQLANETEKQIVESLLDKEIIATPQEQKVINKTILFLGTEELFINYRQEVINRLIDCYCNLASKSKSTKLVAFNSMMGITSKLANTVPGGGVAETPLGILGDTINLAGTIIQEKNLKQCIKKMQEIFAKDKMNLNLFDESYSSLTKTILPNNNQGEIIKSIIDTLQLDKTQLKPFSDNHNVFKVGEVWEKDLPNLDLEGLKIFLEKLDKSLEGFRQEFQQQRKQLTDQAWFIAIEEKTDLLKEQTQSQIQISPK